MGKAFRKKTKRGQGWDCPICGAAGLKSKVCASCGTEMVQLVPPEPDEPGEGALLRLSGRVGRVFAAVGCGAAAPAGTAARRDPEAWLASFELSVPGGRRLRVACRRRTLTRFALEQEHWLAALQPGVRAQVLVRVAPLDPALHGAPPAAAADDSTGGAMDASADIALGARARAVALGADAKKEMDRAIFDLADEGTSCADERDRIPDGLRVEQIYGADGRRRLRLTQVPDPADLWSPRVIIPGVSLFVLWQVLALGGWRLWYYVLPLAGLLALSGYFWLVKLNRRVITLGPERVTVAFKPLPWPGWSCPAGDLAGLLTYDANPPQATMASYRPDTLIAKRRHGPRRALLRDADKYRVYFTLQLVKRTYGLADEAIDD